MRKMTERPYYYIVRKINYKTKKENKNELFPVYKSFPYLMGQTSLKLFFHFLFDDNRKSLIRAKSSK